MNAPHPVLTLVVRCVVYQLPYGATARVRSHIQTSRCAGCSNDSVATRLGRHCRSPRTASRPRCARKASGCCALCSRRACCSRRSSRLWLSACSAARARSSCNRPSGNHLAGVPEAPVWPPQAEKVVPTPTALQPMIIRMPCTAWAMNHGDRSPGSRPGASAHPRALDLRRAQRERAACTVPCGEQRADLHARQSRS